MAEDVSISSIIEEGPLEGASIPLDLWMQLNGKRIVPLDLEEIDNDTSE